MIYACFLPAKCHARPLKCACVCCREERNQSHADAFYSKFNLDDPEIEMGDISISPLNLGSLLHNKIFALFIRDCVTRININLRAEHKRYINYSFEKFTN